MVKPIEQDEKISFALFAFEVQIFPLPGNFFTENEFLEPRGNYTKIKKFSQNGLPTGL